MRFFAGYLASRVSNENARYIPLLGLAEEEEEEEEEADDARGVICTQKREARSGNAATRRLREGEEKGEKAAETRREKSGTCIFTGTRDSATARRWSGTGRSKDNWPESKYECENKNWITARKLQFFRSGKGIEI